MKPDLTDEETDALLRLLRDTIDADHYPLSPRGMEGQSRQDPTREKTRAAAAPETFRAAASGAISATVKSYSCPPMTLGNAASAQPVELCGVGIAAIELANGTSALGR